MARLESIDHTPYRSEAHEDRLNWERVVDGRMIKGLPQLFWADGKPWREANLWLMEGACNQEVDLKTVQAKATCLHTYANWLETSDNKWWDFPARKENRCLVRYRGALVAARDNSELSSSTVSQRMRVVVSFYRWLAATNLLSPAWPMWKERTVGVHLSNPFGFKRTLAITTTDLAIPNRARPGERLESGLLPVSASDRNQILDFAQSQASEELFLLLITGFFTGMRIQTLTDLKVKTLSNATPDPCDPNLYRINVGPAASPSVATKFDVTGQVWITRELLEKLLRYSHSERRLKREIKASPDHKDLVFLTRFGNPYAQRGSNKSAAINVEMHGFRKIALANGIQSMRNFRFHQTRCTFATELARLAISFGGGLHAVAIVKEALLHKNESTALKYIKFVEKTPIKRELANSFTKAFLGIISGKH
ncbi:integrase [Pseudomonas putida]|uniref:site-specific integrase n=1 Tax=Pseudomonas putida TaxID=303 RepID=UPI0007B6D19B|nr:site-specific integrase [Pseudomonas putida]ANC01149.1 integrase [Pseudomonas putida]